MTSLIGTGKLVRLILRRDRVRIAVWVGLLTLAVLGSEASLPQSYPTAADRQDRAELIDNPATTFITGPGYGLDDYTYGAMTANEMSGLVAVAVALMSILMVVRQTRLEEETGRAELVQAGVVGRLAPTAATLLVVGGMNLAVGVLLTLGLPVALDELSAYGSLVFAAGVMSVGLVFMGVALLAAQLTEHARAASGIAGAALGLVFVLRGVGDIGPGALSWLSPIGWTQETRAYVDERWWPLLLSVATTGGLVALATAVQARRDLGAGVLSARPGPPVASRAVAQPFGLALRLGRAGLIAWSVSLLLAGVLYGTVADEADDFFSSTTAQKYLNRIGAGEPTDQFVAMILFFGATAGAANAIQTAWRLRSEETAMRAEAVLATPLNRVRWLGTHLGVALGGSVVVLLALGLGFGLARAVSEGDADELPSILGAALAYSPAMWAFAGLVVALFGLAPRAIGAAWGLLGSIIFVAWLGPLLSLPDWVYDLSPFEQTPRLPLEDLTVGPLAAITLVAAGLIAAGTLGFRHREIGV